VNYGIVEKFFTLSGEAPRAGRPMYLIRFAGCNLDCRYCDTPYRDEAGLHLDQDALRADIRAAIAAYPAAFVLFTGGEPLLGERQTGLPAIARALPDILFYVETNGSVPLPEGAPSNLRFVADWKSESSGHGDSFVLDNLARLRPGLDCIKFVVNRDDLAELAGRVAVARRECPGVELFASPQWGDIDLGDLAAFIVDRRLDLGLSLQLHKIIWGNRRGV
jgi:7-carboxy-7-deazaguanine synthase